ncbi:hypothetical protein V1515DRAFT_599175 [Lipomyces mesembrius]
MIMHSSVLRQAEVQALQEANQAANRRHQRPRQRLKRGGTLTVQEGLDLIQRIEVDKHIQHETRVRTLNWVRIQRSKGDAAIAAKLVIIRERVKRILRNYRRIFFVYVNKILSMWLVISMIFGG